MKTMRITQRDYINANRRASREAEIENHTRPVNFCRVQKSRKVYDRKRSKAENKKALPYLFLYRWVDRAQRFEIPSRART
ncbi:MAG: hypothetical protein RSE22_07410 [Mucinivorans sp.]